jgi:hypothetical protein
LLCVSEISFRPALSGEAIGDVLARFTLRTLESDEFFARAGDVNDRLGFVVDGLFVMTVDRPGSRST